MRESSAPAAPSDEVGLEPDGIQLQAAAVEVACVDRPADGIDGGRDGLRPRAAPRAHQGRIGPSVRFLARQIDLEGGERLDTLRRAEGVVPDERERRRQDADHRIGIPLQPHLRADDRGIGAEAVPQPVRQHDHVRASAADFVGRKTASEHGPHAEQREEVRRDHGDRDLARVGALAQREDPPEERLKRRDVLDDRAGLLQLRDIGSRDEAPLQVADRSVIAPDVIQVISIPVRHRLDQNLVDDGVHDGDHAEPDGQRADRDRRERAGAQQSTQRELRVAAPIAAAPPGDRGPRAFAGAVAQRIHERAHPHEREPRNAAAAQGVARAIAVGLHDGVAHVVAEVGRIQTLKEPEPALGHVHEAIADRHFAAFGSRPPMRAARVRASSRLAAAVATRRPVSVMR
jgi:hypothetical protein